MNGTSNKELPNMGSIQRNSVLVKVGVFLACLGLALASLQSEFLDAHTAARAAVGVEPLQWDDEVAAYAENYVATLRDEHACQLVHSGGKYGENLYGWSGSGVAPPSATDAVNAWVDEKKDYDAANNQCAQGAVCGHYTQVVWRNSKKLGCAYLNCNANQVVVSCNYDPPGNYVGQRPY